MARTDVKAAATGTVWKVEVKPGESVGRSDPIVILESMKMEIPIMPPQAGTVVEVLVAEDDVVDEGQVVAVMEI